MFVKIGETTYAVPIASVRGVGRIGREQLAKATRTTATAAKSTRCTISACCSAMRAAKAEGQLQMPLLLIRSGELRAAVSIDQVVGNREIVVKPVGPQVGSVPGIFGATIMGDGSRRRDPRRRTAGAPPGGDAARHRAGRRSAEARRVPLVMVVDDSVTMRKVTGRVLERHNFEVATAKDGVDALENAWTSACPT